MAAAALYMGTCSGHGTGSGSSHHPGLGGGIQPKCTFPANTDVKVVPKTVMLMNATTLWAPTPQRSVTELVRTVRINAIGPILDQDVLIPHPTPTMHTVSYTGIPKGCPPGVIPNNAWWCTIGTLAGENPLQGTLVNCSLPSRRFLLMVVVQVDLEILLGIFHQHFHAPLW